MSVVPSQILYLEHESSRLYAEAIQIIDTRHLCWARPTLLIEGLPVKDSQRTRQDIISTAAHSPEQSPLHLYDLEGGPDLIWPLALFHVALDIDFFSLILHLKTSPDKTDQQRSSRQLNDFVRRFWHSHTDRFQSSVDERSS
ncbi:MAG: hypothetical protein WBD47_17760 [Phormidesmis sp.]